MLKNEKLKIFGLKATQLELKERRNDDLLLYFLIFFSLSIVLLSDSSVYVLDRKRYSIKISSQFMFINKQKTG